ASAPEGLLECEECACRRTAHAAGEQALCANQPGQGEDSQDARSPFQVEPNPNPAHPLTPCCPDGCCCFCMAKAPCCLSSPLPLILTAPCLGPSLAELAFSIPPAHTSDLLRPPIS